MDTSNDLINLKADDICRCLKEHFFALMATAKNTDETKMLLDLLRPLSLVSQANMESFDRSLQLGETVWR